MGCGGVDTLGAWVAGALPGAARAAIANHAAACAPCHALIEGLLGTSRPPAGTAAVPDGAAGCADALARTEPGQARWPAASLLRSEGFAEKLPPGTRVGRYAIDAVIGAGGMSVVYAALDRELHRRVAIKLLRPVRHRAARGELVLHEARTLAQLCHPNVVTVFDVGRHRGRVFVAMELIDGVTLRAWLARAPRTSHDILTRLRDAGRGLAAAHAASVIHRDIKPDNILVGRDGRTRVIDFGLARPSAAGATSPRTIAGTPMCMAPEQLRGEPTAHSDQWSFCATLYEALAGVHPFAGDAATRTAAIAAGRLGHPAAGHRVPRWVRPIIARGLRAAPSARWPSMAAVVRALEREPIRSRDSLRNQRTMQ